MTASARLAELPADNPFAGDWSTPHGLPPFEAIRPEHFSPAFAAAIEAHAREIATIAGSGAAPRFENTVAAMER
ncbi:hypothetical protein, partial [Klebsiella pneumoniae]